MQKNALKFLMLMLCIGVGNLYAQTAAPVKENSSLAKLHRQNLKQKLRDQILQLRPLNYLMLVIVILK